MRAILFLLFFLLFPLAVQAEEEGDAALRLKLIRVNLYLETNQSDKALDLLETIKAEYPDNPKVLAAEASAYLQAGYRGKTIGLLNSLSVLSPGDDSMRYLRERAMSSDHPYAAIDEDIRFSGDYLTEHLTRFSGAVPYSTQLSAGMVLEHDRIDGSGGAYKGDNTRGELYGAYNYDNGNRATASLFMADAVTGLGLWQNWLDNCGSSSIGVDIQRPNWDFVEQVAGKGRRDQVQISRTHLFTPRLNMTGSVALNRYGLNDEPNIANSAALFAGISYILPPFKAIDLVKHHASLWLNYALDAEHPFQVTKKTDSDGFVFTPLPLESREVHSMTVTLSQDVHKDVSYELFAGYAYDRLGGDGPLFGAYLTWWPLKQLALEGNISRSIRKETSSEAVDNMGIKGKWLF